MGSGGHPRSGPARVEGSRTSDRRGYSLAALPVEGYGGDVPELADFLPAVTERHEAIWAGLWTTPQAWAWAHEPWRWPIVADLVKWSVRSDAEDAAAAIATTVRQLRDDLGLSAAGLKQNGWKIAEPKKDDEPPESTEGASDDEPPESTEGASVTSIKDRLNRGSA